MQRLLEHIRRESLVAVWWWGPTAVSILFRRELEDLVVCTATVKEWMRATNLLKLEVPYTPSTDWGVGIALNSMV